jgi:hypothetical protein
VRYGAETIMPHAQAQRSISANGPRSQATMQELDYLE